MQQVLQAFIYLLFTFIKTNLISEQIRENSGFLASNYLGCWSIEILLQMDRVI